MDVAVSPWLNFSLVPLYYPLSPLSLVLGAFVFKRNNPAKLVWQEFLILNIYLTTNDV